MTTQSDSTPHLSRRRFLTLAGGSALVTAATLAGPAALHRLRATAEGDDTAYGAAANAVDTGLILVTIQLEGGLDFLDTVIPLESSRYQQLRRSSGVDLTATHRIDDTFALHPSLPYLGERWASGELGIVHGVGYPDSSLSHFVDTAIWERGQVENSGTGWIGRSLHAYGGNDADPLIGLSIGNLTPAMYGPSWNPVALAEDGRMPWTPEFLDDNPGLARAYGDLLTTSATDSSSLSARVRSSQNLVREVADTIGGVTDLSALQETLALFEDPEDEAVEEAAAVAVEEAVDQGELSEGSGQLARQLGVVADLINGGLPTRAFHVTHGGDFDTHAEQAAQLPTLLRQLDEGLRSFDRRLGINRDRVVIATWTEFGRRPDWNGSGTDHGTAGTQFVIGPRAVAGHHGDPVTLDRFDRDDNFLVTGDFRRYLAGLAQGSLGVDPGLIFEPGIDPLVVVR